MAETWALTGPGLGAAGGPGSVDQDLEVVVCHAAIGGLVLVCVVTATVAVAVWGMGI